MYYLWIFILVSTLIILSIIIYTIDKIKKELNFWVFFQMFIIVPIFTGSIIGIISFALTSHIVTQNYKKTDEIIISSNKLLTLNSENEINGKYSSAFFIGSGYINEVKYYGYYKVLNNGDIIFEKGKATNIRINYSDNPKIVKYGKIYNQKIIENNNWLSNSQKNRIDYDRTVIYIPKGTIKTNYDL